MISIIEPIAQAENIKLIIDLYLQGKSIVGIMKELE